MKRYTRVRAYATMSALVFAIMPTGCLTVNVDASTKTTTDDHAVRELVGPDHSANVKLQRQAFCYLLFAINEFILR